MPWMNMHIIKGNCMNSVPRLAQVDWQVFTQLGLHTTRADASADAPAQLSVFYFPCQLPPYLYLQYTTIKVQKLTAPGIPKRSPIQVLSRPGSVWLPRSDEIGLALSGMAVSCQKRNSAT